jgi:hypothetical protein
MGRRQKTAAFDGVVPTPVLARFATCHKTIQPTFATLQQQTTFISNKALRLLVGRCAFSFHLLSLCRHSYASALRLSFPLRLLHPPPAVLSTAMDPFPEHTPKQASYKEKATTEWNVDDLVGWIKEKRPHLLNDDKIEKLRTAEITGDVFLDRDVDREFFENKCKLSVGIAVVLANLSRELAKEDGKLLSFMSAHHVDSKLTTSQETDSKPEMWRCPPPPPIALVSPPTTHLCCSLYTNPYYSDRTHDEEKGSTSHRHSASTKENPSR